MQLGLQAYQLYVMDDDQENSDGSNAIMSFAKSRQESMVRTSTKFRVSFGHILALLALSNISLK